MLKKKQKKCLFYGMLVALLVSVAATSSAYARDENVAPPPAADANGQPTADEPLLIMTLDGNVTVPESQSDQPNLYQAQDAPAGVDDNSTRVIAQDDAGNSQENVLIAPQPSPDYSVLMVGITGLFAVAIAVGAFLIVRKRKAID